ncbi:MAG: sensor histidine kinase [Verrucomicrobia bacterium]|nr:MAG: sensor histidine kinase [Verrucomicrobiota bacterium]
MTQGFALPNQRKKFTFIAMHESIPERQSISLRWIVRMRWLAVLGQALAAVLAWWLYDVAVPWLPISLIFVTTIVSNGIFPHYPQLLLRGWSLWLDVVLLTVLIYFTGGQHNPFTSFYLLHVALAAMTLSPARLWSLVAACIAGYGIIFYDHQPIQIGGMELSSGCESYDWHLQGMFVAFVVTAVFIAAFVSRMHRILAAQDAALEEARLEAQKNAHFASLATLSAGVAHELGSPLATISLASSELLHHLSASDHPDAREDAELIHQQVKRCRNILDHLNEKNTFGLGDPCVPVTAAQLHAAVIADLPADLQRRLSCEWSDDSSSCALPFDSVLQSIIILLNNAHQADRSDAPLTWRLELNRSECRIEVIDAGPAPSAEILARAGDPFFTSKAPGDGMGLGLFLVKCLALRLHGSFSLTRSEQDRTHALLILPTPLDASL